jgi:hypothetical protein
MITRMRTVFVAALLVTTAMIVPAQAANASGRSGTLYGCYAQWWNTAFAGYCYSVPQTVSPWLWADCSGVEGDYNGPQVRITKGSSDAPFDNSSCIWGVKTASPAVAIWVP